MTTDLFSVHQFFLDGSTEQVRENVIAEEAVKAAFHYTESIGAQLGITRRVIITDSDDCCVFEWKKEIGVTFPPCKANNFKDLRS